MADDHSTDDSFEIAKRIAAADWRVKAYQNPRRMGLARNKQLACSKANGEFLTFLDADDYYCSEEKIGREMTLLRAHENANDATCVAYSIRRLVGSDGVVQVPESPEPIAEGILFFPILMRELRHMPRDFLVRTDAFWSVGGFDTNSSLYVDWILKIRLARFYPYVCTGLDGIHTVRHGRGMASASYAFGLKALWHAYIGHRDLINEGPLWKLRSDLIFFAKHRPRLMRLSRLVWRKSLELGLRRWWLQTSRF